MKQHWQEKLNIYNFKNHCLLIIRQKMLNSEPTTKNRAVAKIYVHFSSEII